MRILVSALYQQQKELILSNFCRNKIRCFQINKKLSAQYIGTDSFLFIYFLRAIITPNPRTRNPTTTPVAGKESPVFGNFIIDEA